MAASAWPKAPATSAEALPDSTQRRIRQPSSSASTSGTATPPPSVTSPSQRRPCASAAKKPSGACDTVFMIAVVPSESRSFVAVAVSPPAIGAVATTECPSSSSACWAMSGWRVN